MKHSSSSRLVIFSVVIGLGLWLILLFIALAWFQNNYVQSFTAQQPKFLQAQYAEQWFKELLVHLPKKQSSARVIQFWKPGCLCNRFARPHALKATELANKLGYEHITLIPSSSAAVASELQALNPDTHIIALASSLLNDWPTSPSVLIEGPLSQLLYMGPLGFGSFCNEATTSVIDSQLNGISTGVTRPFFNQIGKGCFCPWNSVK